MASLSPVRLSLVLSLFPALAVSQQRPVQPGEMELPDFGGGRSTPFYIVGFGTEADPAKTGKTGRIVLSATVNQWPERNARASFEWTIDDRALSGLNTQSIAVEGVPPGKHRFCARAFNGGSTTAFRCGEVDVPGAPARRPGPPPADPTTPASPGTGGLRSLSSGQRTQLRVEPNQTQTIRAQCESFANNLALVELLSGMSTLGLLNDVGARDERVAETRIKAAAILRVMAVCGKAFSQPAAKAFEGAQKAMGAGTLAKAAGVGPAFDIEVPDGAVGIRAPDGGSCQVRTPQATVSAPQSAEFVVSHDPQTRQTFLATRSGVVFITSNDLLQSGVDVTSATFPIRAGQSITVGQN